MLSDPRNYLSVVIRSDKIRNAAYASWRITLVGSEYDDLTAHDDCIWLVKGKSVNKCRRERCLIRHSGLLEGGQCILRQRKLRLVGGGDVETHVSR